MYFLFLYILRAWHDNVKPNTWESTSLILLALSYLFDGEMESGTIVILKINVEIASSFLCTGKSSIIPSPGPSNICQASLTCVYQTFLPKLKMSPGKNIHSETARGRASRDRDGKGVVREANETGKHVSPGVKTRKELPKGRWPSANAGEQWV